MGDLQDRLRDLIEGASLEILRTRNMRLVERAVSSMDTGETLDDLDEHEVFARCLEAHGTPLEQQGELISAFLEAVAALHEDDARGEP